MRRLIILFLFGALVGCASNDNQPGERKRDVIKEYSCGQIRAEMDLLAKAEAAPVRSTAPGVRQGSVNPVSGRDLDSAFPDPRSKHQTGELSSHRYNQLRESWFEKRCGDL